MRFDGVDIKTLGRISIKRERLPGVARALEPLETNTGLLLGHVGEEGGTFEMEVNICAGDAAEAGESYLALAAWAKGSGGVCQLEPTGLKLKAYDAVFEDIESPNLVNHRGTVRIRWLVTDPHPHSTMERSISSQAGEVQPYVNGTAESWPVLELAPAADTESVSFLINGEEVARFNGTVRSSGKLVIDMRHEEVVANGLDAGEKMDWQHTDYGAMLKPGMNTVSCATPGTLTVRWHDRWA